jgi:hypothetical protein
MFQKRSHLKCVCFMNNWSTSFWKSHGHMFEVEGGHMFEVEGGHMFEVEGGCMFEWIIGQHHFERVTSKIEQD